MPHKHLSKIKFHFLVKGADFRDRTRLKNFIITLFKKEGHRLESLNYIFCSDKYLLSINQTFLFHDYYTDIVTFDQSETKRIVTGEIYISIPRVRENARIYKQSFDSELRRVISHGILHLMGYSDKTTAQKAKMRMKEEACLSLWKEGSTWNEPFNCRVSFTWNRHKKRCFQNTM